MNSSLPDRREDRFPLLGTDEQSSQGPATTLRGNDEEELAKESSKDGERKSSLYLFLLTLSIGGLQMVWSVELSNGSPYLLSLGMDKSLLAFVWIAGPLTGTLVQPYVGICSDNCRIPWGKRKPFMIGGGIATIISLLALAWAREIVGGVLGIFGVPFRSTGVKVTSIVLATILMYCLDFAINTVQATIRAFIVDNAPAHQQESANAWASRLTGIGNIVGYILGYLNLPKILPFFGKTQFQVLCMIASLSLGITLLISCLYITERDPQLEGPPSSDNPGVVAFFKQVFKSIRSLPPQIRKVCEVQLFAWIGWFPFLFYCTTYIGQLYVNPIFEKHPHLPPEEIDEAWEAATRVGTFALLVYAIVSFVASMILPLLVVPTYRQSSQTPKAVAPDTSLHPYLSRRESTSAVSITASSVAVLLAPTNETVEPAVTSAEAEAPTPFSHLQIPGFTLHRAWLMSHILFSACMFSTFFIRTPQGGTFVVALVGVSWALTLWAPFALISAEVANSDAKKRRRRYRLHQARLEAAGGSLPPAPAGGREQDGVASNQENSRDGHEEREVQQDGGASIPSRCIPASSASTSAPFRGNHVKPSSEGENEDDGSNIDEAAEDQDEDRSEDEEGDYDENDTSDQAGIILGIHNVAISCPQILSTLVSSVIFNALQKPRGEPWDDSVGWVLRFGGLAAIGAAWVARGLGEGSDGKAGSRSRLRRMRDVV
ncbi:hypothetical protein ACO22_02333 [Paracoccidioides brasiliensis]|uniref:Uncharacterized protein n=1 Tax=Paracoccidioides brasiliensis TaxID=121759 RepID=A0A1D2JJ04_PARBR|nr:hypothetical protein ACO22_02333 [Paracoccidioides brasiliensis]ODH48599.1 hypothetical protein GX48_05249 [Paracoccidioides brasiliensis]